MSKFTKDLKSLPGHRHLLFLWLQTQNDNLLHAPHTLNASSAATVPASLAANKVWEEAYLSRQVASKTRNWPVFHGITAAPSGHFPFEKQMPVDSKWEGTSADVSDVLMISLMAAWWGCLP